MLHGMAFVKLTNTDADVFVPDGRGESEALARTTHMVIGAHQDDIEFMASLPLINERYSSLDPHQLGEADHFDQLVVSEVCEDRDAFEDGDAFFRRNG